MIMNLWVVRKKDDAETIRDYLVTERFAATVYHGSLPVRRSIKVNKE